MQCIFRSLPFSSPIFLMLYRLRRFCFLFQFRFFISPSIISSYFWNLFSVSERITRKSKLERKKKTSYPMKILLFRFFLEKIIDRNKKIFSIPSVFIFQQSRTSRVVKLIKNTGESDRDSKNTPNNFFLLFVWKKPRRRILRKNAKKISQRL